MPWILCTIFWIYFSEKIAVLTRHQIFNIWVIVVHLVAKLFWKRQVGYVEIWYKLLICRTAFFQYYSHLRCVIFIAKISLTTLTTLQASLLWVLRHTWHWNRATTLGGRLPAAELSLLVALLGCVLYHPWKDVHKINSVCWGFRQHLFPNHSGITIV